MPLYTGIGDHGTTALFDGTTVAKTDIRVVAYGEVDELNPLIGVAHAMGLSDGLSEIVVSIQQDLFALGSLLADPTSKISERVTKVTLGDSDVKRLEGWIDRLRLCGCRVSSCTVRPLRRHTIRGESEYQWNP